AGCEVVDDVARAGGVGCPVESEAGRVPRREVGFGHRALAVIDDRQRLVGQPAAGDATGLVVLARAGPDRLFVPPVKPIPNWNVEVNDSLVCESVHRTSATGVSPRL